MPAATAETTCSCPLVSPMDLRAPSAISRMETVQSPRRGWKYSAEVRPRFLKTFDGSSLHAKGANERYTPVGVRTRAIGPSGRLLRNAFEVGAVLPSHSRKLSAPCWRLCVCSKQSRTEDAFRSMPLHSSSRLSPKMKHGRNYAEQ